VSSLKDANWIAQNGFVDVDAEPRRGVPADADPAQDDLEIHPDIERNGIERDSDGFHGPC